MPPRPPPIATLLAVTGLLAFLFILWNEAAP